MGIKILFMSDLHIGHPKVPPDIMYRNLKKFIYPILLSGDVDILIIGGDFFDRLLHLDAVSSYTASKIIHELDEMSFEKGFKIRVLRGTFSHDRNQVNHFIIPNSGKGDVKIFDTMSIEYIEDLGIVIMYVPDDLPYDNAQSEIIRKIKEQNLEQVDVMVLHGYCKHEVPIDIPILPYNCFDSDFLKDYVKGPILKGHIHQRSVYKTTINNGSTERLQHNEEDKKGYHLIHIKNVKKGEFSYQFIENTDTAIFSSILIKDDDIVDSFVSGVNQILDKVNENTPLPINIRYVGSHNTIMMLDPYSFEFRYPIRFSHKLTTKKKVEAASKDIIPLEMLPKITKENISGLLSSFLNKELSESCIEEIFALEEM